MNIYLDVQSPAVKQAGAMASLYGLEHHGLTNLRRVYWNLPRPRSTRRRSTAPRGSSATRAPRGGHRQAHGPRRRRQVRGARAVDRGARLVGPVQPALQPGELQRAPRAPLRLPAGPGRLRAGRLRGADPEHRLPVRIITQKAWHSLFARTMFLKNSTVEEARRHVPDFTIIAAPGFQASPMADGTRCETFIVAELPPEARDHRRDAATRERSRRRSSPSSTTCCRSRASSRCTARRTWARRATSRSSSASPDRQDDAPRRPRAPTGRRRRARLGPERRLQLRGRLLREDDPPVGRGRAADLRHHPPLRDDPRERGLRPRLAHARPQRREAHREHPRRLPARLHRERGARQAGGPPEERRLPDLRRKRRHAARSRGSRPTRPSTTSSRATRARSRAPRSASASSRR